jgi:hypothetical protein
MRGVRQAPQGENLVGVCAKDRCNRVFVNYLNDCLLCELEFTASHPFESSYRLGVNPTTPTLQVFVIKRRVLQV